MEPDRSPFNGKPFYCRQCGLGFGEYMACGDVVCELESTEDAIERKRKHDEHLLSLKETKKGR